jgi:hypothetical protein
MICEVEMDDPQMAENGWRMDMDLGEGGKLSNGPVGQNPIREQWNNHHFSCITLFLFPKHDQCCPLTNVTFFLHDLHFLLTNVTLNHTISLFLKPELEAMLSAHFWTLIEWCTSG